jgi:GntR family transcriptional regulator
VPAALVPGLAQEGTLERSLYGLLRERYGIRLVRATQSLEAVAANEYEAQVLHVKEGTPLLLLERVSRDEQDRPVEFVRSLYRGDRYRFITELNRREEAP